MHVLQGRFEMPLIAPVLVTVFTLALYSVGLPYLGASDTNLNYMPAVKTLFAVQLVAAAVMYTAVVFGVTPVSFEERFTRVEATLADHTVTLADHTVLLNNHTAQLNTLTALVRAIIQHFNITTT